jgi:hypothetical protein
MKRLGLLLVFAVSLTWAQKAAPPVKPAPAPQKSACVLVLQQQMQADTAAALQTRADARRAGMETGAALGAGGMLLFVGLALEVKKAMQRDSASQKPLSRAASA